MKKIDERGKACPLPVIETKKTLEGMQSGESLEVLVDNEIAVQNLTKFATQKGYEVQAEKKDEQLFSVVITLPQNMTTIQVNQTEESEQEIDCIPSSIENGELVVISANTMGAGEEELGKALMKAFIFALTKQNHYPQTILFYNGGAFISCEDSDSLEDLKFLEAQGTTILTCGTCLNFYGLGEKLAVGDVTNMYDIVERMQNAKNIIRP